MLKLAFASMKSVPISVQLSLIYRQINPLNESEGALLPQS